MISINTHGHTLLDVDYCAKIRQTMVDMSTVTGALGRILADALSDPGDPRMNRRRSA
jgi:hypothetical protein